MILLEMMMINHCRIMPASKPQLIIYSSIVIVNRLMQAVLLNVQLNLVKDGFAMELLKKDLDLISYCILLKVSIEKFCFILTTGLE